ncbi:pyridoxamine 5-phosphate oxidase [Prochlorococcus marinus XMU1406]|uniref:pyridoxamine 5'-phosphate oxidase family protein n=1 Tax=Prochlorococcus marinus TaxID=1219 RepID=UPI001AD9E7C1|nr:pyridoxamine 5'-phosphate oxidase family protein [Prochlorococcus marinus]MBO8206937.1 pyridoxamine 5-phosphate oxidase [Prochlorococcus marinus XMU1406]MCR8542755.1 pyridoxamine 5'-phosphate oxidase family protein [Prochlorococcus marinus XMU1427]
MLEDNLPSWRQDLKSSRKKEGKSPTNRWIQLATVSDKNEPRLRTVVFRGWYKDSSMIIFTDRRSEKIGHLTSNPNAEILWFFLKTKSQYRFKGKILELKDNKNYWDSLSEKSKSSWFWGSPGEKINPQVRSDYEISSKIPKSENFVVLNFEIDSVDLLKLEQPIHKRYLWEKINNWEKVAINP